MIRAVIYWAILLLICAFAFWRGRLEERIAAGACLAATIVTVWIIPPVALRYSAIGPRTTCHRWRDAGDVCHQSRFARIASGRCGSAGLQLTISTSHLLKAIDSDLLPRAYAAAAVLWSYPIL